MNSNLLETQSSLRPSAEISLSKFSFVRVRLTRTADFSAKDLSLPRKQRKQLRPQPSLSHPIAEPTMLQQRNQPTRHSLCRSLLYTSRVSFSCIDFIREMRPWLTPSIQHSTPEYNAPTLANPFPVDHMPLPISLNIYAV